MKWFLLLAVLVTAVVLVKIHVAEPFSISSPSMEPSLRPDDRVVVDKLRYRLGDPRRGDVVVFDKPAAAGGSAPVKDLVQRVIAVAGDEIEARDGIVYVNGKAVDESYLRPGTVTTDIAQPAHPRRPLLGDGRPPGGVRGQPTVRADPRVGDPGPGRRPHLARHRHGLDQGRLTAGPSSG